MIGQNRYSSQKADSATDTRDKHGSTCKDDYRYEVEAEDGTITVYTAPTDLHKGIEALRANGIEEFQVTELEMIPQSEVTLEGEDLEIFEKLVDALEADEDVQKVYHNVADF